MRTARPLPRLERPLSLGEILDRALTLLTSSWSVFLTLAAIGMLPWLAYYYWYEVQSWRFPGNTAATSVGSWFWFAYVGSGLLARLMSAAIAVMAAHLYCGRRLYAGGALGGVGRRWEVVAPCAAIATAILLAEHQAFAPLTRDAALPGSALPTTGDIVLSYLVGIVAGIVRQAVSFFGNVLMSAAALEPADISGCLRIALKVMFAPDRLPTLLAMCVALFALTSIAEQARNLEFIVTLRFNLAPSPLFNTAYYALFNIPLAAFTGLAAISYYFDARLRDGVNVPAALDERDDETGEEAQAAGPK